jgi:hypothetical protein
MPRPLQVACFEMGIGPQLKTLSFFLLRTYAKLSETLISWRTWRLIFWLFCVSPASSRIMKFFHLPGNVAELR